MNSLIHATVTGVVQGVCFRWFVEREANKLGITGWVRNRFDGAVELEAEGNKAELEALIKMLRIGPRLSSVKGLNVEWLPYEGKFKSFDITF